jgi:hypothetical protein
MLFDKYTDDVPRDPHLKRWFLAAGAFGVLEAVLLAIAIRYDYVSSNLLVALWPAAMVQLSDPKTVGSKIAVVLIAYGSNFLIYGLVGVGIGLTSNSLFRLLKRR